MAGNAIVGASFGQDGFANTGGGGGGGSACNARGDMGLGYDGVSQRTAGGNGGSGVVIVRYQSPTAVSAPNSVSVVAAPLALNVTWSAPTKSAGSVTGYQVEHSTTGTTSGTWTVASSTVPEGTTSFSITGLSSSTAYYVRVAARYSSGLGPYAYPWTSKYRTTTPTRNGSGNINYASGSAGQAQTSFTRVRYVMAATQNTVNRTVDANFDRVMSGSGFTHLGNLNSIANLQVPTPTNGLVIQGNVSDLTVISSTGGLVADGHGLSGRLELWGFNYAGAAPTGMSSRQGGTFYDDADTHATGAGSSYGSFQLHNLGSSSRQTIFSWNEHGGAPEVGFGSNNAVGSHSDWTFCSSTDCPNPTSFSLEIFVNEPVTPQPAPVYTVTYDFDGATGGASPSTSSFTSGGTAITLPSPTKSGLLFKGWYSDVNRTNFVARGGAQYSPNASGTLYADWTNIVINLDASSLPSSPTTWPGTLPGAGSESGTINENTSLATDGSIKSLTFDGSGDGVVFPNSAGRVSGAMTFETWLNPTAFSNPDWQIIATRWFTATGAGSDLDFHFAMKRSVNTVKLNLYTTGSSDIYGSRDFVVSGTGKWYHVGFTIDANNQLQFFVNGQRDGSPVTVARTASSLSTFTVGDVRNNNGFIGKISKLRIYNKALTDSEITSSYKSDASTFSHRVVTFNANDATATPATSTQNVGTNTPTTLETSAFTRTGYTLTGWTTSANGTGTSYTANGTITTSNDVNLFAVWTANPNTVTFNSNFTDGPTATTQSITTDAETALKANTFTRSGYTFAGWNTAANGTGTPYTNSQNVTLQGPLTLFAVWYRISITTQPVGKASGTTLQTQPVVRIEDGNGATVTSDSTTSVTVAISSGSGGTLGGTQTLRVTNGVATFTDVTLAGTVGTNYVLTFTSTPSWNAAVSQNVTVTPGAVSAANSTVTPVTATIFADGVSTQKFTVTLKDAQGNTFATTNDTVTFTRSNSLGTFETTVNTAPGVYEGTYTSGTSPGTDTITVTANTINLSTQPVITLNPGVPSTTTSTVTAAATSLTADGTSTSLITVRLKDSSGNNIPRGGANVSISVDSGPGSIQAGSLTDNGNGTYTATYLASTAVGPAVIKAKIGNDFIDDFETITLNPGTATKLGVTVQPSNSNASGATLAMQPKVAIQDANGNTVTTASATITVGLVGDNGTLGGTRTATTTSGVAEFSGLTLAGLTTNSYNLSFSASSLTGVDSEPISITPGAASLSESTVRASSTSIVADGSTTSTITVQLKDAQGNPLNAEVAETVSVSVSSGGGSIPSTSYTSDGAYTATFTSPITVGDSVIQATIGGNKILETASIELVHGDATSIKITQTPITGANASELTRQPEITLFDANNNIVTTNSSGTVGVALVSGDKRSLSGTDQVTFANGVATFTNLAITGRTSTNYVLRFTSGSFTVDSSDLTLTPGIASAATSTIVISDSTLIANGASTATVTVRLKDAQTNALIASGGTVVITVPEGSGSITNLKDNEDGTYTATYTSGTTEGVETISASVNEVTLTDTEQVTLIHGPAAKIRITQQPTGTASGTALGDQPIVEITDINNNRVVADGSTIVTVAISAGSGGNLGGTQTAKAATGLVQFTNLSLSGLVGQPYKLTFSSGSLTTAESSEFSVTPGVAVVGKTTITASNTSITANGTSTSTITVQLKDAQGNSLTTTDNDTVSIRVDSGTGNVGSTLPAGNGTFAATFTSSTTAGTSTIRASLGANDITETQNIALVPGTATKLGVLVEPSDYTPSGEVLETVPQVAIQDANGNTVTTFLDTTITVDVLGTDGIVGGTLSAETLNGVATFGGLTLAGLTTESYRLRFSADELDDVDSEIIYVTPGAASTQTSTVVASLDSIVADGATTSEITVTLKDAQGNELISAGSESVLISKKSGEGTLSGTTNNGDGTYTATFTSPKEVGATVIQATISTSTIVDTKSITLRHGVATQLVITRAPVAGASSSLLTTQPRVTLQDANGNTVTSNSVGFVTVAISSGANGTLTGSKSLVLSSGVATFDDLKLAGKTGTNYVLRFESGLFATTSENIQVAAGAASTVTSNVSVSSNSLMANRTSTATITVTLRDSESNQLASGGDDVVLSVTPGFGSIDTFTDNEDGTYTATYTSGTSVGSATISATLNTVPIDETKDIELVHGPAAKILMIQEPEGSSSGTALSAQPHVEITDIFYNRVTGDSSTEVTAAISSGEEGTLGGTLVATADAGLVTFTDLTLAGLVSERYKLTFSFEDLSPAESQEIVVTPGIAVADKSTITASLDSIVADGNSTSLVTVQLKDAQGNSLTTNTDTVSIRVDEGTGNVGSTLPTGNGTYAATFTSSTTAGISTIRASLGANDITATKDISLTPGTATKLGILTEPPTTTSSGTILSTQPQIEVQDAFGNTVTEDSGRSITIGLIGEDGSLAGNQTASTSSGIATFSGISLAGLVSERYVLSFRANDLTGVDSEPISITPGAASLSTSTVIASNTSIVADGATTSTITVQLKDAQGNPLNAAVAETVSVSVFSGGGSVPSTTYSSNGAYIATFTSPKTVGDSVIQATIDGNKILETASIELVHGDATQIVITQTPTSGANASTLTRQPEITLFDANDNVVTSNSSGSVEVALFSGDDGELSGTTQATFDEGVATFTNLAITGRTSTNYVLRFTSGSFTVDSGNLTLTPGIASAATSTIAISDTTLVANGASTATVTVRLKDAQTNSLVASGGTVAITVATSDGSISNFSNNNDGTYTATYTSGRAVGTKTISASVNSVTLIDTEQVTLVHGPAAKILMIQQPEGTSSGTELGTQPQVEITDAFNNRVTGDGPIQVTAAISLGEEGTLGGTLTITSSLGVATFTNLTLAGLVSESYKLTFSSGSLTVIESSAISVTPGRAVAGRSTISASSTSITANETATSTITVQLKDAQGNLLVAGGNSVGMQITTGDGNLDSVEDNRDGTYSAVYTSSRVAGPIEIRARLAGVEIGEVQNLTLTPGLPTKLGLHVAPITGRSGEALTTQPEISVQDEFGNTVTTDSGRLITVAISAGNGGSLTPDPATATTQNGIARFSGVVLAGITTSRYELEFTTPDLESVNSAILSVSSGAASVTTSTFETSNPSIVANGVTTSLITLTIRDAQGNALTESAGTVEMFVTDGHEGSIEEPVTDKGDGTYTAIYTSGVSDGSTTITATLNGISLTEVVTIELVAGPATQLSIVTEPQGGRSAENLSQQPVIHLLDTFGNHAIQEPTTPVTIGIKSGESGFIDGTTTIQAIEGVATFTDLTLAGLVTEDYILQFTSETLVSVDSGEVVVTPGVPSVETSTVSSAAQSLVADEINTTTVTITLKDAQGNELVTGDAPVGLSVSPVTNGLDSLGSVGSVIDRSNGTYTATYTAGTKVQSVRFSATLDGNEIEDTALLSLTHGTAYQIAVETNPEGGASGSQLLMQPTVLIQDKHGNTVTDDNDRVVTVSLGGQQNSGTLSGSLTTLTLNGLASFSGIVMTGRTGTNYVLDYSATDLIFDVRDSANFTISPGAINTVNSVIDSDLSQIVADGEETSLITVTIRDTEGNTVSGNPGTVVLNVVTAAGEIAKGTLSEVIFIGDGTYTSVFTAGTVSGDVSISGTLDGASLGTSASLRLVSGPAHHLEVLTQPDGNASGTALNQPQVIIRDFYDNAVDDDSTTVVTATLKSGDGGVLTGVTQVSALNGYVQWSDLAMTGIVGEDYTLEFTATDLESTESNPFRLTPGTPTQLLLTTPAAVANSGAAFETQPVLSAQDAQGNVATDFTADVTASITGASLQGVATIPLTRGVAAFTDLGMFGDANSSYQVTYTTSSLSLSVSQSLVLNPGAASFLEVIMEPTNEYNGQVFGTQPVIQIRDAQNNAVATDTPVNVTATITSGSGVLSGTSLVTTNATGRATFTDLMITGDTGNYILTFTVGGLAADTNSFNLAPGTQAITASEFGSDALPDGTYTPEATSYSGLEVEITIADASLAICTIDENNEVTFLKMGACVIEYNQSGNDHWLAAPQETETLTVGRKTQLIEFDAIDDQPFGGTDVPLVAEADSGLEVVFAVTSDPAICVLNSGATIQIKNLGTCTIVASQEGDEVWLPASDVTLDFEIGTVRPATPTVASVSAGDKQATISWNPPTHDGGSPITGYRVTADPSDLSCTTTNADDSSCTITGLENGTDYRFRVVAINAIDPSQPSEWSPSVKPATTADAVVELTLSSTNKKLTANWTMPDELGGGNFVRFEMFIRETGESYGDAFTSNDPGLTSFEFTKTDPNDSSDSSDLVNGQSYDVMIVIITDAIMESDQDATVISGNTTEATQVPADVPTAPTDATILTTDGTQASISWIASSSDGGSVITAYSVTATANSVAVTCLMQTPLDTNCEISSLRPGQAINVSIRSVNRIGDSVALTTSMTLPTPPAAPKLNTATSRNGYIQVVWSAPASDGGMALTGYIAKAMKRGTNQVIAECTTIGTTCDLIVTGTEYDFDFAVWSMNRVGMSDSSNVLSPKRPSVSPTPTPTPKREPVTNAGAQAAVWSSRNPMYLPSGEQISLQLGTTMAWRNGEFVEVNLVAAGTSVLQLSAAGGVVLQMQSLHLSGNPMDVSATGMLQIYQNRTIRIAGSGFAPNSYATVWIFSEETKLGEIMTDGSGSFAEAFAISGSFPLGDHTIQINGEHPDGSVRTVAMGVNVMGEDFAPVEEVTTEASGPSESDSNQVLGVIGAVALAFLGGIGVGILTLSQRRRKS
jgi:uncharacterized repeat protein (TIGR02543 family)